MKRSSTFKSWITAGARREVIKSISTRTSEEDASRDRSLSGQLRLSPPTWTYVRTKRKSEAREKSEGSGRRLISEKETKRDVLVGSRRVVRKTGRRADVATLLADGEIRDSEEDLVTETGETCRTRVETAMLSAT